MELDTTAPAQHGSTGTCLCHLASTSSLSIVRDCQTSAVPLYLSSCWSSHAAGFDVRCNQLLADPSASGWHLLLALQGHMLWSAAFARDQEQGSVPATPAASSKASSAACFLLQTLYNALLENNCSEQASRMAAMESSTKNATEMISKLSLQYNRWAPT